jgi:hypothetical protein
MREVVVRRKHRRRGDEVLHLDGAVKESSGDGHVRESKDSSSGSLEERFCQQK